MEISRKSIMAFAAENNYNSNGPYITDLAGEYGSTGENSTEGVIIGSFSWRDNDGNSVFFEDKYPRLAAKLEEQGFTLESYDDMVVDHETGKAYRTTPTHYGWMPDYVMTEHGELITADSDIEEMIEWAKESTDRAIPCNIFDRDTLIDNGFVDFNMWHVPAADKYEYGWHEGMTADPVKIKEYMMQVLVPNCKYREVDPDDDMDIVFQLEETSQFYVTFKAYFRMRDDDNEPIDFRTRTAISNNHFSHDQQLDDVIRHIKDSSPYMWRKLYEAWPIINHRYMDGSTMDFTSEMADPETSMWITDWIEDNTNIFWEDGEPFMFDKDSWDIG